MKKKAWHIINQEKSLYYLVAVLPHQQDNGKVHIEYQKEKYFINQKQLLPYQPQKSKNFYELQENNSAQIVDWMRQSFQHQGFWLKVSKKLIIDFNNNTAKQRQEFIRFIFGRFLVCEKRRQYLCIANDSFMCNKNGQITSIIFQVINSTNIWNYKVPLNDLGKIYAIFFRDVPIKLKFYVKNSEIIKMAIVPYIFFSKQLLGTTNTTNVMTLTGRIFNVMASSRKELKNYYRVPSKSIPTQEESENLQELTNYLLHNGFTVFQVKEIISMFSLIMNINVLQITKGRKQDKIKFKIKEGSIIKDNLECLIGQSLVKLLEKELNQYKDMNDCNKNGIRIKQQLMMRLIYEQIILKVSYILNEKMCNLSTSFQDYKQFIMIQFPPSDQNSQDTIQHHYLDLINQKIQSQGLEIPFDKQTHHFKHETVYRQIKKENQYDINKDILNTMEKSITWIQQMRRCQFMLTLKATKIDCINKKINSQKQGKIEDLYQELQDIQKNQDYFINYIIQTYVNQRNIPARQELIKKLQKSIDVKRERAKEKYQTRRSSNNQEGENVQVLQEEQMQEDFIDIKLPIFQQRYAYCSILKQFYRSDPNKSVPHKLQQYFHSNKINGHVNHDENKLSIGLDYYSSLQRQRYSHEGVINKIKNQFKRAKFRHSIFVNLKKLYGKIKFNKFLIKKVYPLQKYSFNMLKKRLSALRVSNLLLRPSLKMQKNGLKQIKISSGINLMKKILKDKQSAVDTKRQMMRRLKKIFKISRANQFANKLILFSEKRQLRLKRLCFKKLNKEYHIVVNPPQSINRNTNPSSIAQKKEQIKKPEISIKNNVQPLDNKPSEKNQQSSPVKNQNPPVPIKQQIPPPPPLQKKEFPLINSQENNQSSLKKQEVPPPPPPLVNTSEKVHKVNQPVADNFTSQPSNDYSSFGNSTNRGIQKSETSRKITQHQLFNIKDNPKFSFQIWMKQAVGFQKRKPAESEKNETVKDLFSKSSQQKVPHKQPPEELNVDILIKEKVVVNPFFPYLMEHIDADTQQKMQKIMSHQEKNIKQPLLSLYPKEKYPNIPTQTFNNILKIGLDKNTSKSKAQLINMIVKPIKDTYHNEKSNISTVFDGQPAIIADYSWDHNLIKDEIFMEFIKQIMMNQKEESLNALAACLEVITRYYYPSPKFLYPFLHFLKSLQSKNIEKLNQCFVNTLLFAQVYERYKGSNVTVLKQEIFPKQKESHPCLEPRITQITDKQVQGCLTISIRLLNDQIYEYTVRNQTLSHFKRKVLKQINMLNYEQYFGIYYAYQATSNCFIMNQSKKVIDHLNEYTQSKTDHLLYVKLKYYFPFSIKQINKTRIMYLSSVSEQKNLPWKVKNYESIVVLSMLFDQFQQYRISNYLVMTNQVQGNVDLTPIQNRYTEVASNRGKKISQLQYFKQVKESGFLGAKAYKIKDQSQDSILKKITRIVTKPLELCLYKGDQLKSSIALHRVKGYGLEKGQIHIQLDYIDEENHRGMRHMALKNVDRIQQLYADLSAYIGYLSAS